MNRMSDVLQAFKAQSARGSKLRRQAPKRRSQAVRTSHWTELITFLQLAITQAIPATILIAQPQLPSVDDVSFSLWRSLLKHKKRSTCGILPLPALPSPRMPSPSWPQVQGATWIPVQDCDPARAPVRSASAMHSQTARARPWQLADSVPTVHCWRIRVSPANRLRRGRTYVPVSGSRAYRIHRMGLRVYNPVLPLDGQSFTLGFAAHPTSPDSN
ncbi:hypothetical protein LXA43DRAFT_288972 [Ganoderma leucocontextum]|nr:hypothetical protein LXA43DRAFT_288972 [Ganoderma leucocontextum]